MWTLKEIENEVIKQVRKDTPSVIVESIAKQLLRARSASERIDKEGLIARDAKGAVISHPCIAIEKDAGKMAVDMLAKFRRF